MQYWINHNGVQSGPLEIDAIKEMGLTSKAYVWHEGLSEWVNITQVPSLQGMYAMVNEPAEAMTGQPVHPAQQPIQEAAAVCPPTNLVWAIITTVLCCLPAGIVAIVYALKVQNKYREGDLEGAKRASETGAWWCIASIILGILSMPFAFMLQSMAMS